jgi:hypothetical protein
MDLNLTVETDVKLFYWSAGLLLYVTVYLIDNF